MEKHRFGWRYPQITAPEGEIKAEFAGTGGQSGLGKIIGTVMPQRFADQHDQIDDVTMIERQI
jgi:hypothetical protein